MVSFTEAIEICLIKKFVTISGRATRAEYWWFQLFIYLSSFVMTFLAAVFADIMGSKDAAQVGVGVGSLYFIIMIIPSFCARIRRLHDAGHSGWYILWGCVPYIGGLIILIAELESSDLHNEYGPNPKYLDSNNPVYPNTNNINVQAGTNSNGHREINQITNVNL